MERYGYSWTKTRATRKAYALPRRLGAFALLRQEVAHDLASGTDVVDARHALARVQRPGIEQAARAVVGCREWPGQRQPRPLEPRDGALHRHRHGRERR